MPDVRAHMHVHGTSTRDFSCQKQERDIARTEVVLYSVFLCVLAADCMTTVWDLGTGPPHVAFPVKNKNVMLLDVMYGVFLM